jgi:peptidoglycan/LPS O-acetylase OafA/YrhL
MNKIAEIERLRGLAIILVVVAHISYIHTYLPPYLWQTYTGVDLFFVISGFVVTLSFTKTDHLSAATSIKLHKFYIKRFFRIIPAALLWAVIPLLFVGIWGDPYNRVTDNISLFKEFFSIIFFYHNFSSIYNSIPKILGPYWSLSVEEHFYIAFPILMIIFKRRNARILTFLTISILSIFFFRAHFPPPNKQITEFYWLRYATQNRLDFLGLGVLIALTKNKFEKIKMNELIPTVLICILWMSGAIFILYKISINYSLVILLIVCSLLVFIASLEKNIVLNFRYLNKTFEYFGSRSYSLYLIHNSTELILKRIYPGQTFSHLMLWGGATFILTELSYKLIEQPLIRYGYSKVNTQ